MTLKRFLADHGITQRELAGAVRVHESSVSRWIDGGQAPRFAMLHDVLTFLRLRTGEDVTFEQIFGEEPTAGDVEASETAELTDTTAPDDATAPILAPTPAPSTDAATLTPTE